MCVQDFCEELEYWALDDLHLEPCCQHTYYRARYRAYNNITFICAYERGQSVLL